MSKLPPLDLEETRSRFRELAFDRCRGKSLKDRDWLLYRFVQAHPIEAVDLLNQLDEDERQGRKREQRH